MGGECRAVLAHRPLRPPGGNRADRRAARSAPAAQPRARGSAGAGALARPRPAPRRADSAAGRGPHSRGPAPGRGGVLVIRPVALLLTLLQGAPAPRAPDYPFAVGETLTYSAKLGMLTLGQGMLQVAAIDSVRGRETFRFRFRLTGKTVFYSMDDVLESWVSTGSFESHRFVQDFNENDKPKHRTYEIFPDSGFFREVGRDTTYATPDDPLDDAAFFYFVRITPLEVGKTYTFDRYFRKEKNPVTIQVLKREK